MASASWRSLPEWPVEAFDPIALSLIEAPKDAALARLLKTPFDSFRTHPCNFQELRRLFWLDGAEHCFAEDAHNWTNFLEPQITKGFVHFLDSGGRSDRVARCVTFAAAAWRLAYGDRHRFDHEAIRRVVALPEDGRSDIIVELHTSDGVIGIVIEAKFGATLTKHQLESYRRHALQRPGWDSSRSLFLVLLRDQTRQDRRVLSDNPDWQWGYWWDFLAMLDQEMSELIDDRGYRQFRRTVWSQAV